MCKKPGREYGKKNMTEARKAAGYIVLSLSLFPLLRQLAVCRSATVPTVGGRGEGVLGELVTTGRVFVSLYTQGRAD